MGKHIVYGVSFEEAREMKSVGYPLVSCEPYHFVHLIARPRHNEPYAFGLLQHGGSHLYEILGSLLHRYPAQKCYYLVLAGFLAKFVCTLQRHNGVVYRRNLIGRYVVLLYDGLSGEVADGDDMVCRVHTLFLDTVYFGVYPPAAAVVVCGVDVYYKRSARYVFGKNTRRIGQPVVRMYYVELQRMSQNTRHRLVVVYLLEQIRRIDTRKLHATDVVYPDTCKVVSYAAAEAEIFVGIARAFHSVFVRNITPHYRHRIGSYYAEKTRVFVAVRLGDNERYLHIFLCCHTFGKPVACRAESSEYMGRKLPTKHQ